MLPDSHLAFVLLQERSVFVHAQQRSAAEFRNLRGLVDHVAEKLPVCTVDGDIQRAMQGQTAERNPWLSWGLALDVQVRLAAGVP